MKNNINQRAIAASLGHVSSIITVDVYTDKRAILGDAVEEMEEFIEGHLYTDEDINILKEKYGREGSGG